jgi:hypothetical protein
MDDTSQLARTKIAEATTIANLLFNIFKSPFFTTYLFYQTQGKK